MIRGIGVDIVSVARIEVAMRRNGFLERILTPDELDLDLVPMRVASRWACKEAIYKALGGGIKWQDLSIVNDTIRAPMIIWHRDISDFGPVKIHITLSHERENAVAVAVVESLE
ncbi:MAG: holo-ACP synthase [Chthonomonas sp.]|nr:holo-ACP synthase [Chthonomonas sp.]